MAANFKRDDYETLVWELSDAENHTHFRQQSSSFNS